MMHLLYLHKLEVLAIQCVLRQTTPVGAAAKATRGTTKHRSSSKDQESSKEVTSGVSLGATVSPSRDDRYSGQCESDVSKTGSPYTQLIAPH